MMTLSLELPIIKKLLALLTFAAGITVVPGSPINRNELLPELIRLNDNSIPAALSFQWTERDNAYYGAVFDRDSVVSPGGTAGLIQTLMCSYVSPSSKYYNSREILSRMVLAADGLLSLQHEDGTIDLLSTNFHSTPDLGFTIYPVALSYSMMLKNSGLNWGELPSLMKQYLLNAGKALSTGGIHTPNHRWVVSGALAWLYSFFPDPAYKARIDQWLAEKVDIDPDGQYNERSTSVYTPVTNRSLLEIAKRMKYDYLYDIVRRNLNLTFYLVHSNGEIVTETSNRQDKYVRSNLSGYFLAYNYMAILDKDKRFAGMVDFIEKSVPLAQLRYMLPYIIEDPAILQDLPEPTPLPDYYNKYFKYSDMVRIREGDVDISVITNNTTFFTYFKGEAAIEGMRLSSAFFGKGQFQSTDLEIVDSTYILSSLLYGPYYQPLPKEKLPAEGEAWSKVPRILREQSEVQKLSTKVYLTIIGKKTIVKVRVDGPENLPVTLEIGFREGGTFTGITKKEGIEGAFLAKNGEFVSYKRADDIIKIGPGVLTHKWTQLRGALPKLEADCLYFTDYAPCEFEFSIF